MTDIFTEVADSVARRDDALLHASEHIHYSQIAASELYEIVALVFKTITALQEQVAQQAAQLAELRAEVERRTGEF